VLSYYLHEDSFLTVTKIKCEGCWKTAVSNKLQRINYSNIHETEKLI